MGCISDPEEQKLYEALEGALHDLEEKAPNIGRRVRADYNRLSTLKWNMRWADFPIECEDVREHPAYELLADIREKLVRLTQSSAQ
jgi:hypothetical protein